MPLGEFTRQEIASQPEIWEITYEKIFAQKAELTDRLELLKKRPFVVIGCGSTYYLSAHTAAVLRRLGIQAWAVPSSELVFFPQADLPADFVLLVISRSGTTTESLWAMDAYRKQAAHPTIVSITCTPGTAMIARSDITLLSEAAGERSVAQTRSFTSMVLMAQMLAAILAGDEQRLAALRNAPAVARDLFERWHALAEQIGRDTSIERFFFLGSGPYFGLANEAMLKTKEMSSSWAEAYHTLEFRHGPMSVVNEHTLVTGLVSTSAADAEVKVLREMKAQGARVLAFCEQPRRYRLERHRLGDRSGQRIGRLVPAIPVLAGHPVDRLLPLAGAGGMDPDSPGSLVQVIVLE